MKKRVVISSVAIVAAMIWAPVGNCAAKSKSTATARQERLRSCPVPPRPAPNMPAWLARLLAQEVGQDGAIAIQASPSVLVLGLQGEWMTIHADIPYSDVEPGAPLTLNGVDADVVFADSRGDLVAKFDQAAIRAIVSPPSALLTLEGRTTAGEPFSGSVAVVVRELGKK